MQKLACIRDLPNVYINVNNLCSTGVTDYWDKFYSYYVHKKRRMISVPDYNSAHYRRFVMLCQSISKYYLSIYQIVKFILFGRCRIIPIELNPTLLKNNVKMLDIAWFGITRQYNESKMRILLKLTILNSIIKKLFNTNLQLSILNLNF